LSTNPSIRVLNFIFYFIFLSFFTFQDCYGQESFAINVEVQNSCDNLNSYLSSNKFEELKASVRVASAGGLIRFHTEDLSALQSFDDLVPYLVPVRKEI